MISIETDVDDISIQGKEGIKTDKTNPESMTQKEIEDEIKQLTKRINKAVGSLTLRC